MAETLTIDYRKPFALFPLDQVVLLPHAAAPLHIFEDRYRAMTRDALDSSGLIAMACVDHQPRVGEASEDHTAPHGPPLRPHVCVGYIVRHERMSDGRYNIVLQGIARATLEEELEPAQGGYRRATLKPLEVQPTFEMDYDTQREKLDYLLNESALVQLASVKAMQSWLQAELPTPAVADLVTCVLCRNPDQRYAILSEGDPSVRIDWLVSYLEATRRTLELAAAQGSAIDDGGLPLN